MLFNASYHSSLDVLTLLPEVMLCVACDEASAEHRIQATVIALKIATDIDPLALDSIYRQAEPLFGRIASLDPNRLEADMVYHSVRGDGPRGMAAARTLVDLARKSKDPVRLTHALGNAANSYRINGLLREADDCLYEALDCSVKHHLVERARVAMQRLVRTRLSRGELAVARDILEQSKALPVGLENLVSAAEQHVLEVWLALKEGNLPLAISEFLLISEDSYAFTPSRRAAYLALEAQISVAEGASPDALRPIAGALETAHKKIWGMGLQDSEAEALYVILNAVGEGERAVALLREYLNNHRRETEPPPQWLSELLSGQFEHKPSSLTPVFLGD